MTENLKEINYKNEASTQPKKVEKKLITITGITTSQINQALKADKPYPARVFLRVDQQEADIPVFFRMKDSQGNYIRPKIRTGSLIQVEGNFAINKEMFPNCKMRKSFTAYSYNNPRNKNLWKNIKN